MEFDLTHTSDSVTQQLCLERFGLILRDWIWFQDFGGEKKLHASGLLWNLEDRQDDRLDDKKEIIPGEFKDVKRMVKRRMQVISLREETQ